MKFTIPEAHLIMPADRHIISPRRGGRAWRINDPAAPAGNGTPGRLWEIADYLNVESSKRYEPRKGKTYCNVYASDFCNLAGAYLPRVWWMKTDGCYKKVNPVYGKTVREMSANSLWKWLEDYGDIFGWDFIWGRGYDKRFSVAQQYVNEGKIVIISGFNMKGPGHICVVLPESREIKARADHPVISEAGGINYKATNLSYWWKIQNKTTKFTGLGVWVNKGRE